MHDVTIVGAGFSGALVAVHLSRLLPAASSVVLVDPSAEPGLGLAYSTLEPCHFLNVRAANMSAYPDEPGDFEHWLNRHHEVVGGRVAASDSGLFVSRSIYGRYIKDHLTAAQAGQRVSLSIRRDRAVGLVADGDAFAVETASGERIRTRAVVLALGHAAPPPDSGGHVFVNPWVPQVYEGLDPDRPILIRGTGLTMVDIVTSLHERGFKGPIVAVSRRGLLPQAHAPARPAAPRIDPNDRPVGLARWLRALRDHAREVEAEGGTWRDVVDGLRPITRALWAGMPVEARARFLRHARPWWDIHRHRMAPATATLVDALKASGQLQVLAGRVTGVEERSDGVEVRLQRRHTGEQTSVLCQRMIDAIGVQSVGPDPLLDGLIGSGQGRLDPLGLGLEVDPSLRLVRADGTASAGIWALGPLVRGTFWECTAVPDIRGQAAQVAAALAET